MYFKMHIILEGWKLIDTYTRLCRVHCGYFKASLINFSPSSPKTLSAKHKCVSLLLLMRAKDRSLQPATVRPQLSKLKEKQMGRVSQIPKFILLLSFTGKLAGTYISLTPQLYAQPHQSYLNRWWIPLQLCTGYDKTKHRRGEEKPGKKWK